MTPDELYVVELELGTHVFYSRLNDYDFWAWFFRTRSLEEVVELWWKLEMERLSRKYDEYVSTHNAIPGGHEWMQ
jgi:hypothetical protein